MTARSEITGPDLGGLQQRYQALRSALLEVQLEAAFWLPCVDPAHSFEPGLGCFLVDEVAPDGGSFAPFNAGQLIAVPHVCPRRFEAAGVALSSPINLGRSTERNAP